MSLVPSLVHQRVKLGKQRRQKWIHEGKPGMNPLQQGLKP